MKKLLFAMILLLALPAKAVSFENGDFSFGNSLWTDASVSGSLLFANGQASLQTGNGVGAFSTVMVQGDDGSFSFSNPVSLGANINWLLFDASFESLGVDGTEAGNSPFFDSLYINLYDSINSSLDLFLNPVINSTLDGAGFASYALAISPLQGRDVAISYELADENDGVNSRVMIDNVRLVSSLSDTTVLNPVPVPLSVGWLLFVTLPLVGFKRLKRISC